MKLPQGITCPLPPQPLDTGCVCTTARPEHEGRTHAHTCVHVCACVCSRATTGQAPLACCTPVFALRLPCAFQGTWGIWQPGAGALRGLGVFCSTHAFTYGCGFDVEKDGAFDVSVRVLCGYFTHAVCSLHRCVCVCVCTCVCVSTCGKCEINVSAGRRSGCWNPCLPGHVIDEYT